MKKLNLFLPKVCAFFLIYGIYLFQHMMEYLTFERKSDYLIFALFIMGIMVIVSPSLLKWKKKKVIKKFAYIRFFH